MKLCIEDSGRQIEQLVVELTLFTNIISADPPRLPLPDHVHRFVPLNRANNQFRNRLSPLEDRRSDCFAHALFRLLTADHHSCNTSSKSVSSSKWNHLSSVSAASKELTRQIKSDK
jgi:hypothetical protein